MHLIMDRQGNIIRIPKTSSVKPLQILLFHHVDETNLEQKQIIGINGPFEMRSKNNEMPQAGLI